MLNRIKSKRIFILAIIVSFMAHFMICLVLRGYKNERCPLSFAFQSGNYGLGAAEKQGSANEVDDGRIQVQLISHSAAPVIKSPPTSLTTPNPPITPVATLIALDDNNPFLSPITENIKVEATPSSAAETAVETASEVLGQADTLANESQTKPTTQPIPESHTKNTSPTNKHSKNTTNFNIANNCRNNDLDTSNQAGPGLAGGHTYHSASAIRNPYPTYPPTARREGLEGEVMVAIEVSATGRVNNVQVTKSSGYTLLDQEVLKTIRKHWGFSPAYSKGIPVASKEELVFRFVLDQK